MASVTLGDCKQGLQWRWEEVWWVVGGGWAPHLVVGLNISKGDTQVCIQNQKTTHIKESKSVIETD